MGEGNGLQRNGLWGTGAEASTCSEREMIQDAEGKKTLDLFSFMDIAGHSQNTPALTTAIETLHSLHPLLGRRHHRFICTDLGLPALNHRHNLWPWMTHPSPCSGAYTTAILAKAAGELGGLGSPASQPAQATKMSAVQSRWFP